METLGLEPKLTTCKIAALPIKLRPLDKLKMQNYLHQV